MSKPNPSRWGRALGALFALVLIVLVVLACIGVRSLIRTDTPPELTSEVLDSDKLSVEWKVHVRAIPSDSGLNSPRQAIEKLEPLVAKVEKQLGTFNEKPVFLVLDHLHGSGLEKGYDRKGKRIVLERHQRRFDLAPIVEARLSEIRGDDVPTLLRDGLAQAISRGEHWHLDWEKASERDSYILVTAMERLQGLSLAEIARKKQSEFPDIAEWEGRVRAFHRVTSSASWLSGDSHYIAALFEAPPLESWDSYDKEALDWRSYGKDGGYTAASFVLSDWLRKNPGFKAHTVKLSDLPPYPETRRKLIEKKLVELLMLYGLKDLSEEVRLRPDDKLLAELKELGPLTREDALKDPGKVMGKRAKLTGILLAYALHQSGYSIAEMEGWTRVSWMKVKSPRPLPEETDPIVLIRNCGDPRLKDFGR